MNLNEIKKAVDNNENVYWSNKGYQVKKYNNDYYIVFSANQNMIGLTWADNITINGKEEDFFIN